LGSIRDRTVKKHGRCCWDGYRDEIYAVANKRGRLDRQRPEAYKQADGILVSKLVGKDMKHLYDETMQDERKLFWIDDVRRILGENLTEFFSSNGVLVEKKGIFLHIPESLLDSQIKYLTEISDSFGYGLYKFAYFWNAGRSSEGIRYAHGLHGISRGGPGGTFTRPQRRFFHRHFGGGI
jgi:hypothetical protein